ncbi:lipocalin-like domain-containing protein [Roseobacter sinensis]|uniref:Iron ABC transporter permease n=1 Tax=Roseobacter sinensis TaxID=2931391 RepID=A0ABT3BEP6_9RHOB|nr:lipocalin-like domain-containing protein [Roseobacter sp. WL0113]MCV3272050.1 iron ABC transporter permease [Roseobacter sp. WL0113]
MNASAFLAAALALVLSAGVALSQSFAGLGSDAEGFALPERGYVFDFPADHGAHPAYRIEWWYLTANLTGADGVEYGLQWTLFRSALAPEERPGWRSPQLWLGHAAVTTPEAHYVAERRARGGIGQAGVIAHPFEAWIDDWQMAGADMQRMRLTARGAEFAYDMRLEAQGPLIFHGENGYSQKSASGRASYYYSQPFFEIAGTLTLPDGPVEVTGQAWLDREWASQPLGASQISWDWFSMAFDDGNRLMGFTLRDSAGPDYTAATWIEPDGTTTAFPDGAFSAEALTESRVAGREIPTRWRAVLPEKGVDVTVEAINPQAWMATSIPYWEGPVRLSGSHRGRGYLEMTGY